MKTPTVVLIVVIFVIAAGGYLVLASSRADRANTAPETATQTTPSTSSPTTTDNPATPAAETGELVEIDMIARQWEFEPAEVTVNQGDRVRMTIKSVDVVHGFALPDFDVDTRLEPGEETVVEFVADKVGTFTFFCSVFCGSGHSEMRGTLIVE